MYRIKELETNVTYDDLYTTPGEAEEQIYKYIEDDGEERKITYAIVNEIGSVLEIH